MMGLIFKNFLIEKTKRDGLLYENFENLYFDIIGFINFLKRGHIIRKIRVNSYLKENKEPKLQLGCDICIIRGFLNSDLQKGEIFIDARKRLPFKDNTFNYIYYSHLIEHLFKKDAEFLLKECRRVLKPKGILRICTPDLDKVINILWGNGGKKSVKLLEEEHMGFHKRSIVPEDKFFKAVYLNNITHKCFGHKYLYNFEYLSFLCKKAGFTMCQKVEFNKSRYEPLRAIDNPLNDKVKELTSMVLECQK